MEEHETDQELLDRYKRVCALCEEAAARRSSFNPSSPVRKRMEQAMWAGCLNFTLLQIQDKLRERGLLVWEPGKGDILHEQENGSQG